MLNITKKVEYALIAIRHMNTSKNRKILITILKLF